MNIEPECDEVGGDKSTTRKKSKVPEQEQIVTPKLEAKVIHLRNEHEVYEFGANLGKGSFGSVYEATYKPTGEKIAVKVSQLTISSDFHTN